MDYYRTNEKYKAILAQAEEIAESNDGVITDTLAELLNSAEIEKEDAIFGLMYDIKNKTLELEAISAAAADLKAKMTAAKLSIETKKRLLADMAGREAYSDGVVSTTKAVTASLVITGDVPEEYKTIEVVTKEVEKIDNKAIKAVLSEGMTPEWAHLEYKKAVK